MKNRGFTQAPSFRQRSGAGFTLIELLVVISILSLLATMAMAALHSARERAKIAKTLHNIDAVRKAVSIFYNDTDRIPAKCNNQSDSDDDPFLNDLGVSGWNGPYMSMYDLTHGWTGHLGVNCQSFAGVGDSCAEFYISLNDDQPGTDTTNNQGLIPDPFSIKLDEILDDGNLNTGNFLYHPQGQEHGTILILTDYPITDQDWCYVAC